MNQRSNVIWIFGDQHPQHLLSCNGNPSVNTPNLDRLATLGVNFTRAVSGYPLCCPFRGSIITGRYPHKAVRGHEHRLEPEEKTIADVFNENGYYTAFFGKWHLAGFPEWLGRATMFVTEPESRGRFKTWIGYDNNNSQWDTWVHGHDGDEEVTLHRLEGYETDVLTDYLIDFLEKHVSKNVQDEDGDEGKHDSNGNPDEMQPFFAVLSVQPPHNPYVAPPEFMSMHNPQDLILRTNVPPIQSIQEQAKKDLAGACAMVENLDWNIGRIMDVLDHLGLSFSTHIIFFSDHGDMHGSHGQFRKTTPYEESLRIPFIIGGEKPAGYDGRGTGNVNAPITHVDIPVTTLGLCGIDRPDWMEGVDYSHYRVRTRKKDNEPDSVFLQSVVPTGHGECIDKPWRGIVTKDGWKYACFEGHEWILFDLNEDPYELHNMAHYSRWRAKKKELNDRLKAWIERTGDDFTLPTF